MHHSRTSMNIQQISKTYRLVKVIPNVAYSSFTLTDLHRLRTCHMREGRAGQWGGSLQWEVSNTRLSQRNRCLFRKQSCMALGLWLYCKDHQRGIEGNHRHVPFQRVRWGWGEEGRFQNRMFVERCRCTVSCGGLMADHISEPLTHSQSLTNKRCYIMQKGAAVNKQYCNTIYCNIQILYIAFFLPTTQQKL